MVIRRALIMRAPLLLVRAHLPAFPQARRIVTATGRVRAETGNYNQVLLHDLIIGREITGAARRWAAGLPPCADYARAESRRAIVPCARVFSLCAECITARAEALAGRRHAVRRAE